MMNSSLNTPSDSGFSLQPISTGIENHSIIIVRNVSVTSRHAELSMYVKVRHIKHWVTFVLQKGFS